MRSSHKLFITLLSFLCTVPGFSEEYSAQPILGITTDIDENKRLLTNQFSPDATIGIRTEAEVKLLMLSEDTSIYITPRLRVSRYSENIGLDTEDKFIDFDMTHLLSEQHQVGLSAGYSVEAVSTSATVIDPVSLSVAGLSFAELDQETMSIAPSYTFFYDEKTSFQTSYSYTDVEYEANQNSFIDYTYDVFSLSGTRALSETDSLTALFYHSDFDTPDIQSNTINDAFQVTYSKDFSETLRASAGLGLTFGETESTVQTIFGPVTQTSTQTGELVSFNIEKEFEKTTVRTGFERRVSPSSQGNERTNDDLSFNLAQRLSERMGGNLGLRYVESESNSPLAGRTTGSEYFSLSGSLNYKLDRQWTVSGGYNYRRVEDTGGNNERDSNGVFVNLRYVADKIIFN